MNEIVVRKVIKLDEYGVGFIDGDPIYCGSDMVALPQIITPMFSEKSVKHQTVVCVQMYKTYSNILMMKKIIKQMKKLGILIVISSSIMTDDIYGEWILMIL
jgi:hypothetical protein